MEPSPNPKKPKARQAEADEGGPAFVGVEWDGKKHTDEKVTIAQQEVGSTAAGTNIWWILIFTL